MHAFSASDSAKIIPYVWTTSLVTMWQLGISVWKVTDAWQTVYSVSHQLLTVQDVRDCNSGSVHAMKFE
jgi:hypothetical protein